MTTKKISQCGEFGLIERLHKSIKPGRRTILGIGDDAAVFEKNSSHYELLTTDMILEGVHFETPRTKAFDIGWKAMACNISDIAAMGGVPQHAVAAVGFPPHLKVSWVDELYRGLGACAKAYGVDVVGGDTNKSDRIILSVALLGEVRKEHLTLRGGAKKGDILFVSGPLGNSLRSGHHLRFRPRLSESSFLVKNFKVNAMIDVSDGLSSDLNHIAKASNVGALLYELMVPCRRGVSSVFQALSEGEDFELLFTLRPKEARRLALAAAKKGFKFYPIGTVMGKGSGLWLLNRKGKLQKIKTQGYTHF